MRIHSRRGLVGYSRREVELYANTLEAACREKREKLQQRIDQLQQELLAIGNLDSTAARTGIARVRQSFGATPGPEATETIGMELEAFRTVLFGLNKRNVKGMLRRFRELQQAELHKLLDELAGLRAEQEWRLSQRARQVASHAHAADTEQRQVLETAMAEIGSAEDETTAAAPLAIAGIPETVDASPEAMADAPAETAAPSLEAPAAAPTEAVNGSPGASSDDLPAGTDSAAEAASPPYLPAMSLRQAAPGKLLAFRQRDGATRPAEPVPAAPAPAPLLPSAGFTPVKPKAVGSGFWEDADDYLQLPRAEAAFGTVMEAAEPMPTSESSSTTYYESAAERQSVARRPETGGGRPPYEPPKAARPQEKLEPKAEAEIPPPAAAVSSGITQEIRELRSKYIVGKIAGEDLHDERGQLLIAKGRTITAQTLQQAEAAGKLAELIVNMIVPGLGDA